MHEHGRLEGKIALITGGAGNIGEVITRRYLEEGATVIITGRNATKLEAYRDFLLKESGFAPERIWTLVMEGARVTDVRAAMQKVAERYGHLDILVNNAGSAGAKQPLHRLPFTREALANLQAEGFSDTETVMDAFGNLLGLSWNTIRAAYPYLSPGASVINVSTIFSRTPYYGRIPYVVPKAALNILSLHLARELGQSEKGIRLNTVYPGPIDSDRIRTVFKAMDGLKGQSEGSTADSFFKIMRLKRRSPEGFVAGFPKKEDVAGTVVFLGSDESAAYSGHLFEVTNGMAVEPESKSSFVSRPGLRIVDAEGKLVLVAAGDTTTVEDALVFARIQARCGAETLLTFSSLQALELASTALKTTDKNISLALLNPLNPASLAELKLERKPDAALVLPGTPGMMYGHSLLNVEDEVASAFTEKELGWAVAMASFLAKLWREDSELTDNPKVIFVTSPYDGNGNVFNDVYRAGVEQLIRVWRHEDEIDVAAQRKQRAVWANQIVRYSNQESENLSFAAAWAAKLLNGDRHIKEINLYLPEKITDATGAQKPSFGWAESLFGLHLGKVALITGGSAGIGGQIGRLLALSGAKVMLAARHEDQLVEMRDSIVRELEQVGYSFPEKRVTIMPDIDVGDEAALQALVEFTLATYGRIDYLINNAGMSGAEEMVIDMPLEAWRYTIQANLTSNYSLIRKVAPLMKQQGGGYIVNVSSYFGGEKYVAVPYPNRSDYAVSKAGQRALVETLARFLGPEIQINAIAPGPVDGIRLQGNKGRPGLYQRRGRLILESKRLNEVYAALIECYRAGANLDEILGLLASNNPQEIASRLDVPAPLYKVIAAIAAKEGPVAEASAYSFLMNQNIAQKLVARLELGAFLLEPVRAMRWLKSLPLPPEPFFSQAEIEREAQKIKESTLGILNLNRMPTEQDVALATIYYLADRNVSGETFHPSGGLRFDRTVTEGELFGKASPGRLEKFYGKTIFIIGEYLEQHITRLAHAYLDEHQAGKVVLITSSQEAADRFCAHFDYYVRRGRLSVQASGNDLEAGLDRAIHEYGAPIACISTPFPALPVTKLASKDSNWAEVFDEKDFARIIEDHITHHFRVARRMSFVDGAQLVLVTPETSRTSQPEEFGLANFIKTTLHAFTVTLAVESERNPHSVPVNQVDLTRRARTEEPQSMDEEEEELSRFVNAVLLTSAPLATPADSRYRSRIYRGNAITV
ncbi:MAG TPA: SDR family oxidoreductase [Chloroflexia bacterium]|nr:SDR family oxidoreductase [Chloroflexia bacterium]